MSYNDFDWKKYCERYGLNYYEDSKGYVTSGLFSFPIIHSNILVTGEVVFANNTLILGTREPTDKEWVQKQVTKIFTTDPAMRQWYIYAGLIKEREDVQQ